MKSRRDLLRDLSIGVLALVPARSANATDGQIQVLPDDAIGAISPDVYGHFTEHVGGVMIYDGIWVGEGSRIPNEGGIRKQLIDYLRPEHARVLERLF